ncbi:methyltransferase domain-containing protein [Streptomyces sp. NPDC048845]|uniref:methyltransferase domain-containing protein n=1 Tax=Streptomyces sp. NPDC048845 TaxID=3155390 RepID=UPI00342CFA00
MPHSAPRTGTDPDPVPAIAPRPDSRPGPTGSGNRPVPPGGTGPGTRTGAGPSAGRGTAGESARLRDALVARLDETGALTDPRWADAFLAVPREVFLRRGWFAPGPGPTGRPGFRPVLPGDPGWPAAVHADAPLVTQLDGALTAAEAVKTADADDGFVRGTPTSALTRPSLVARMLEHLDVFDGARVLEIGTGTGYHAALLAARLGDDRVTTVDIDAGLAGAARDALDACGLRPAVVTGDGADGVPQRAPYDRIVATCATRRLPDAWIGGTATGGRILAPLATGLGGCALVRLTVTRPGIAEGRVLRDDASFLPMRAHATPSWESLRAAAAPQAGGDGRTSFLPGRLRTDDARFIVGLTLPDVVAFRITGSDTDSPAAEPVESDGADPAGGDGLYLAHRSDGSWAYARDDGRLTQGGPQRLWDLAERAATAWAAAGSPAPGDLSFTADGTRQTLSTDRLTWRLPAAGQA